MFIEIGHNLTTAKLYPVNNVTKLNPDLPLPIKQNITFTNDYNLPNKQYLKQYFE